MLEYAQRILSSPGKHDGLHWEGTPDSLAPKSLAGAAEGNEEPYHGYYFRILKAQGPDAPGGVLSYIVNGRMIGGFGLVAWPAVYGAAGIKTFIVSTMASFTERISEPTQRPWPNSWCSSIQIHRGRRSRESELYQLRPPNPNAVLGLLGIHTNGQR